MPNQSMSCGYSSQSAFSFSCKCRRTWRILTEICLEWNKYSIKSSLFLPWFCLPKFGGKKSLLALDRFLHRGTAANLSHACHVSSNFLGGRNASLLLTDSLPAEKGEAQGVFSCQRKNFLPTLWFLLSFLKKKKCLALPQGFPPEDYPQASNMLAFYVCWASI